MLADSGNGTATFKAPSVATVTSLVFSLTATSSDGSSTDEVMVTVNPGTIDQVRTSLSVMVIDICSNNRVKSLPSRLLLGKAEGVLAH